MRRKEAHEQILRYSNDPFMIEWVPPSIRHDYNWGLLVTRGIVFAVYAFSDLQTLATATKHLGGRDPPPPPSPPSLCLNSDIIELHRLCSMFQDSCTAKCVFSPPLCARWRTKTSILGRLSRIRTPASREIALPGGGNDAPVAINVTQIGVTSPA